MARGSNAAFAAAALLVLAACSDTATQPDAASPASPLLRDRLRTEVQVSEVMPGEVIVKFRPGVNAAAAAQGAGLSVAATGYEGRFHVLRVPEGGELAQAAALRANPAVEYVEPNYLRQPTTIDSRLWAFFNPGGLNMKYTSGKKKGQFIPSTYASFADADEDNVEGYAAGGADVVIGSIDTGVDLAHPEFTSAACGGTRVIAGRDWYNNDNDPTDDDGHGSHTTGTMAGCTVGVAGVSGAAPHVRVYVQKVCGRRGCPTSAIVNAIYAAADYPGMVAMNLSLGGSSESQAEKDAILYATSHGVLVIASSGNGGTSTVACPACDPNALAVGSTTWRDERASYSQYGSALDISAPGGNCYSNTTPEGCIYSAYKNGGYSWLQGTSMAAPQVTGTAAIVASVTGLSGAALRSRILGTVDDKGAAGYDTVFGAGRLNSYRAVTNSSLGAGL